MNNYTNAIIGEMAFCNVMETDYGSEFVKPKNWGKFKPSVDKLLNDKPFIRNHTCDVIRECYDKVPNKIWWTGGNLNNYPIRIDNVYNPSDFIASTGDKISGISLKEGLGNNTLKNLGIEIFKKNLGIDFSHLNPLKSQIEKVFFPSNIVNQEDRKKWYKKNKSRIINEIDEVSSIIVSSYCDYLFKNLNLINRVEPRYFKDFIVSVCLNACEEKCKAPQYFRVYFDENKIKIENPYSDYRIKNISRGAPLNLVKKDKKTIIVLSDNLPLMEVTIKYSSDRLCSSIKIICKSL